MTEHQGLPVAGYVPQTSHAVALVNDNKQLEEKCLRVLDDLAENPEVDLRWLAIARTHLQEGWMAANRAIFKPERLK
jgi:hypothetical protein